MKTIDLFTGQARHSAWADASVLEAILGRPEVELDEYVLAKLRHQFLAQRAFLDLWRGRQPDHGLTQALDCRALADFARELHGETIACFNSVRDDELERIVDLPSKKLMAERLGFQPGEPTLAETFLQVYAHNTYHRGQVCSRLRELGIEPPVTDLVVWIWRHRPEPSWSFLF